MSSSALRCISRCSHCFQVSSSPPGLRPWARGELRRKAGIERTVRDDDCLMSCFLAPCALCQEHIVSWKSALAPVEPTQLCHGVHSFAPHRTVERRRQNVIFHHDSCHTHTFPSMAMPFSMRTL